MELANTPLMGVYIGALISSTLGATVSYQIPVFLSILSHDYIPTVMRGFAYGLITLPIGLIVGGLMLGLPLSAIVQTTFPVFILCLVLVFFLLKTPTATVKVLTWFGFFVTGLSYLSFAFVVVGQFFPQFTGLDETLFRDVLVFTFRATIIASGGLVLSSLTVKYCKRPLGYLAKLLGVNETAASGFLLSFTHSVPVLALYPMMDRKGQIVNAAFAVSGAYVLGGQMAFVLQIISKEQAPAYIVTKLLSGITAVVLTLIMERKLTQNALETEKVV